MKKIITLIVICALALTLCGCSESYVVSENISRQADNFNVTRRITVFNIRTDTVLMQMTGKFSLQNNANKELVVICEIEKGVYQKHFVYLNDYTMYTVEDLSGASVSPYQYELEFLPQMLQPVRIRANELIEDFNTP